ncbi:SAF domain-containing protein [Actinokineospora inagensis]|uniref:SAF domain-containing protein n=1 Tax=Actinokineospora inagensis TaxID=103730 RepID=UPI00040FF789|nr:SAF domain-containing protein [Actinokineospora inagensis]
MITPRLPRSLPHAMTVRRALAAVLVLAAVVVACQPPRAEASVPLLVAVRPLAPGVALTATDVRVVRAPPDLRPPSALSEPREVVARIPAGAIGEGEAVTSVRLVGAENLLATAGSDAAAVPVRVADTELLYPGAHVDVVTADHVVLARDAMVVTVRPSDDGGLAVLALPRAAAAEVAATALTAQVAVTLR